MRHERHKCDTSETLATGVWHKCYTNDTSATRVKWKILILITTRLKTYFHTPIFTIWQVKYDKEGNTFIRRTIFWKYLVATFEKCTTKNWTFFMEKYISTSYTLDCSCTLMPLHGSRIVTHSNAASFSIKTILCEKTNILLCKTYWKLGKMNAKFSKNI